MVNEKLDLTDLRESFASWKAHAMHASSDRLVNKLELLQQDYLFVREVKRYYRKHRSVETAPLTQLSFFDKE